MGKGRRIGRGRITPVKEPGCDQFEVFQSVVNPDKRTILKRWSRCLFLSRWKPTLVLD